MITFIALQIGWQMEYDQRLALFDVELLVDLFVSAWASKMEMGTHLSGGIRNGISIPTSFASSGIVPLDTAEDSELKRLNLEAFQLCERVENSLRRTVLRLLSWKSTGFSWQWLSTIAKPFLASR
jgi:hypothetical protein